MTATQQKPLTNKYPGRCQCGQQVPAGAGVAERIGDKFEVRCGKCLGWPQPPRFRRGDKVCVPDEPDVGTVALRCEAEGSRPRLIVTFPTAKGRPAKSVRVLEDDCRPADGGQQPAPRQTIVVQATPQNDLVMAAEDAVADVELAAAQQVQLPDYLIEAVARLDKAIRRYKEQAK